MATYRFESFWEHMMYCEIEANSFEEAKEIAKFATWFDNDPGENLWIRTRGGEIDKNGNMTEDYVELDFGEV